MVQVDLKKVVEHVCDTAGHLLKPRVSLEKMVDQTTPSIAGDGSRIVQVCTALSHINAVIVTVSVAAAVAAPWLLHL